MKYDEEVANTENLEVYEQQTAFYIDHNTHKILHTTFFMKSPMLVRATMNRSKTIYPLRFRFQFDDTFTDVDQTKIKEAGQAWSNFLQSSLNEPIIIKMSRNSYPTGVLAATSNYFTVEKSYSKFKKGFQKIDHPLAAHLPNEPLFNLPSLYTIKGYGYSLAHLRCLQNISISDLKNISYDADIKLNRHIDFSGEKYNLKSVMIHEIGHVLGFISGLDEVSEANIQKKITIFPLDLCRFSSNITMNEIMFSCTSRNMVPCKDMHQYHNTIDYEFLSTGVDGDGYQASHWKNPCGAMISHLNHNETLSITRCDLSAMSALGYSVVYSDDILLSNNIV